MKILVTLVALIVFFAVAWMVSWDPSMTPIGVFMFAFGGLVAAGVNMLRRTVLDVLRIKAETRAIRAETARLRADRRMST